MTGPILQKYGPKTPEELNEAVARKLGWVKDTSSDFLPWWFRSEWLPEAQKIRDIPDYCYSIEAAWEIFDWAQKQKISYNVSFLGNDTFLAQFVRDSRDHWSQISDTAPMAICMAFLKLEETK